MDIPEYEIMPGVYITDYRKNASASSPSSNLNQITAEEYRRELVEKSIIDPSILRSERKRFENSISKLEETNREIKEDPELAYIIDENEKVIDRMNGYIVVLNELLGEQNSVYL